MNIYIVYYDSGYDFDVVYGVFSSKEKAQAYIDKYNTKKKDLWIDEVVVDEEIGYDYNY